MPCWHWMWRTSVRSVWRLGAVLAAVAIGLAGCARGPVQTGPTGTATSGPTTARPSQTPDNTCTAVAGRLNLEQQIGQLFMVGVAATATTVPSDVRELLTTGKAGAVILVGNTTGGVSQVSKLTGSIAAISPHTPVVVAVDQEGGQVQHLQGEGFERIPSALEQGKLPDAEVKTRSGVWGNQLLQSGVMYNLAPVADTVPATIGTLNRPIGALQRGFGADLTTVSAKVSAAVSGYRGAGVATAVKHFPNLGMVTGNTDHTRTVIDSVTGPTSPAIGAFKAGIAAGTSSVMISNAVYTQIEPGTPAVFSKKVIGLLRDGLRFGGVIISDDLGAAAAVGSIPVEDRGVKFLDAGGDLVINVDASSIEAMFAQTVARAKADPEFAATVKTKAARVLALKTQVGLLDCTS